MRREQRRRRRAQQLPRRAPSRRRTTAFSRPAKEREREREREEKRARPIVLVRDWQCGEKGSSTRPSFAGATPPHTSTTHFTEEMRRDITQKRRSGTSLRKQLPQPAPSVSRRGVRCRTRGGSGTIVAHSRRSNSSCGLAPNPRKWGKCFSVPCRGTGCAFAERSECIASDRCIARCFLVRRRAAPIALAGVAEIGGGRGGVGVRRGEGGIKKEQSSNDNNEA